MAVTYEIERCLGRGGFGEVYLATRRAGDGLDRKVAVKVLREDVPNPDGAVARLRDEGRMLALLDHPAIVRVVELTRLRGRIALVTEYVDGFDLARFATSDALLPPRTVADVLAEVAGALHTATHTPSPETGRPLMLIHRDIKPANIRVSRHGETKLLDFGIARTEEVGRNAQTTTGNVPFTLGYTAPETFLDLKQHPPSDVFAWGATLFRLLTGEPFYGELKLTEQASLSGAPDRYERWLQQRLRLVPAAADGARSLLVEALAYHPEARPAIGAVGESLERLAESLPGLPVRRWVRENPVPDEAPPTGALVGLTVSEDRPGDSATIARPGKPPPPPPSPPQGQFVAPLLRESTTDRPVREVVAAVEPPPQGGWMLGLGAAMSLGLFGLAALLLLAAVAVGLMWAFGMP